MHVQGRRGADDLLVPAVPAGAVDPNGDRLVRLVRDDDALTGLLAPRLVLARGRGLAARGGARLGPRALALGPARGRLLAAGGLALGLPLFGSALTPRGRARGPGRAGALAPLLGRELRLGRS